MIIKRYNDISSLEFWLTLAAIAAVIFVIVATVLKINTLELAIIDLQSQKTSAYSDPEVEKSQLLIEHFERVSFPNVLEETPENTTDQIETHHDYNYIPYEYCGYLVGYSWDLAYGYRDDWISWSDQARIQSVWESYGCVSTNNVMTLGGKYMIACKEKFGNLGDWITFGFDNGMEIECVMYDVKGDEWNATEWGHIDSSGYNISVLEFYMVNPYDGVPFMSSNNHVTYWENHGTSPELQ